jgi:hypothetical protein
MTASNFTGRLSDNSELKRFIFETVGPVKRLNVALRSSYHEKEALSFGKYKVRMIGNEVIKPEGSAKSFKGIDVRRIVIQQVGF